jgi:hypothetical protein
MNTFCRTADGPRRRWDGDEYISKFHIFLISTSIVIGVLSICLVYIWLE